MSAGRGAWPFRCRAGRVHSLARRRRQWRRRWRGRRRGDLVRDAARLGTVGQVGRSRNAQTADKRAQRLRNPRREKVCAPSPLSLSSFLLSAAIAATTTTITITITTIVATSSLQPPPSPFHLLLSTDSRTSTDRLLTSTADCLQTNPPTFPTAFTIARQR